MQYLTRLGYNKVTLGVPEYLDSSTMPTAKTFYFTDDASKYNQYNLHKL